MASTETEEERERRKAFFKETGGKIQISIPEKKGAFLEKRVGGGGRLLMANFSANSGSPSFYSGTMTNLRVKTLFFRVLCEGILGYILFPTELILTLFRKTDSSPSLFQKQIFS